MGLEQFLWAAIAMVVFFALLHARPQGYKSTKVKHDRVEKSCLRKTRMAAADETARLIINIKKRRAASRIKHRTYPLLSHDGGYYDYINHKIRQEK